MQWVSSDPVDPDGVLTFSYVVTVTSPLTDGTPIVNQAYTVTGGSAYTDVVGAPVTVTVDAPAILTTTKTADVDPVQAGGMLTYTITITNDATALGPAIGVIVSDTLPVETVYQSMGVVPPATGLITPTDDSLQWQLTSAIQPGASAQVTATVRVTSPLAAGTILTNTYSVTAGNLAVALPDAITTVVTATNSVTLSKTVVPTTTTVGEVVTYTISLTNSGNGIATVALTDQLHPDFDSATVITEVIVPGRTWDAEGVTTVSFTATTPGAMGTYFNRAITATYGLSQATIVDTAPVTVEAPFAAIEVRKTPDSQFVQSGDPVTFTISLTNTGDITLTTVAISDTTVPACEDTVTDLAPGAPHAYTCSVPSVTADFTNTVVATGTPSLGSIVTGTDTALVTLISPALELVKLPATQMVQSGDPVTFTISLTNTGDITLTTVAVTDAAVPDCDDTTADLSPGAPYSYTCSIANVTASFTNTAIVTGTPPAGQVVTDTGLAFVEVITPSIQITKLPDTQTVAATEPVTFTIIVTNTGEVTLTGVTVADPLVADCDRSLGTLPAGADDSYTCSLASAVADFTNTAIVTGTPPVGAPVSDSDTAAVVVIAPDIAITKLPATQLVQNGDPVTFTISLTNTGDITPDHRRHLRHGRCGLRPHRHQSQPRRSLRLHLRHPQCHGRFHQYRGRHRHAGGRQYGDRHRQRVGAGHQPGHPNCQSPRQPDGELR